MCYLKKLLNNIIIIIIIGYRMAIWEDPKKINENQDERNTFRKMDYVLSNNKIIVKTECLLTVKLQ